MTSLEMSAKAERYKPASSVPVLSCDIRHDVLVEELQNEGDAVGKHQMLSHVLKLRDKR